VHAGSEQALQIVYDALLSLSNTCAMRPAVRSARSEQSLIC